MNILVIDDRKDNLISVKALLELVLEERRVETAQTGEEGMRMAIENQPDIILLDIQMPGMNGFEVCKRLKANSQTRHISIIMLTAVQTDSSDRIKGLEFGADAFLTKPIDEVELLAQIRAMMRIKTAEKSLKNEKELLEQIVNERTRSLQESGEQLKRINTLLRVRSDCNKAMAGSQNEQEFFRRICRIIVDTGGYRSAMVGVPGEDSEKRIITAASAGFNSAEIFPQGDEWEWTSDGEPFRTLKPVVRRNSNGDGSAHSRPEKNLPADFKSSMTAPIILNDSAAGVLKLYSDQEDAFAGTAEMIEEIAGDIAYGISMYRLKSEGAKLKAQIQQSQRRQAVGTLAGEIAHEFNNILFPLIGYTEMCIEDVPKGSSMENNLAEILKAAERAGELIDHILSFSRNNVQEKKPVRPHLVIKEALKLISATIPSYITISQHIDKNCGLVLSHPVQIHQVVMNLCINAYHAMQKKNGGISIELVEIFAGENEIPAKWKMPPGLCARLTVSDTGCGIDPSIIDQIFNPYFTTKEEGKGTGLGLSTVRDIVMDIGGAIQVESSPGAGSRFIVYFPVYVENDVIHSKNQPMHIPKGENQLILIVDDEPQIAQMAAGMLGNLGYRTIAVTDSFEALELFREKRNAIDLVVTDQTMPGMTGNILVTELRAVKPDIPVIMCTGFSELFSREDAVKIGVNGYVMKPVVKKDLAGAVFRALIRTCP